MGKKGGKILIFVSIILILCAITVIIYQKSNLNTNKLKKDNDTEQVSNSTTSVEEEELLEDLNGNPYTEGDILNLTEEDLLILSKEGNDNIIKKRWDLEKDRLKVNNDTYYYFTSDDCINCDKIKSKVESVVNEKEVDMVIVNLGENLPENLLLADKFEITAVPTIILTDKVGEVGVIGVGTEEVEKLLNKIVKQ